MKAKPRTKFYGASTVYRQFASDLLRSRIHTGNDVSRFERQAAEYFGSPFAVAVPLARVGIYLCLKFFCNKGDYVLQSPYTLADVINMTVANGCIPLFSDVDRANGHLDPTKLKYEPGIGAMLVTHLHGIPAELTPIKEFAKQHQIPMIEDAAQSVGAEYAGKAVGTHGDAGIFSFGIYKQMNSIYGGLVLTKNAELAQFIKDELAGYRAASRRVLLGKLSSLARLQALTTNPLFSWCMFPLLRHGVLKDVGWINRLTTIETHLVEKQQIDAWFLHQMSASQARMLQTQLPRLTQQDEQRMAAAREYESLLVPAEGLVTPQPPAQSKPTFAQFPIQVPDARNLLRWLNYYGQDVVAQHFYNCAELKCYSKYARECPVASQVARSLILLPTYPGFGSVQVQRNAQIVNRYFETGQPTFDATDRLRLDR